MAVRPALNILPSTPAPSPLSSNNPSMNKRWPPMADRTSLPYKLTTLSKQKLAREATAPDPDIRRCLSHFRLHVRSVEWTQNEMTSKINSIELEDESESEAEPEDDDHKGHPEDNDQESDDVAKNQPEHANSATNNDAGAAPPNDLTLNKAQEQTIQIHFEVTVSPTPPSDKEESLLEKGRNCLEKTVQRTSFWPSPGQCMPVRIAG